jgi:hypothetical protein
MPAEYLDRRTVERVLADRARRDEEFRAQLLSNPKAAISQQFGIGEMPEELVINVVQETPNEIFIALPADPRLGGPVEDLKRERFW